MRSMGMRSMGVRVMAVGRWRWTCRWRRRGCQRGRRMRLVYMRVMCMRVVWMVRMVAVADRAAIATCR